MAVVTGKYKCASCALWYKIDLSKCMGRKIRIVCPNLCCKKISEFFVPVNITNETMWLSLPPKSKSIRIIDIENNLLESEIDSTLYINTPKRTCHWNNKLPYNIAVTPFWDIESQLSTLKINVKQYKELWCNEIKIEENQFYITEGKIVIDGFEMMVL